VKGEVEVDATKRELIPQVNMETPSSQAVSLLGTHCRLKHEEVVC